MDGKKLSCYLAGSFAAFKQYADWRDLVSDELKDVMDFYDPRTATRQGSIATFVSDDLSGVESQDVVFYFMNDGRGDVGAAIECERGNARNKLVVICIEPATVGFVHPFLLGIARRVLIGMDSGIAYLRSLANHGLKNEFAAAYEIMNHRDT